MSSRRSWSSSRSETALAPPQVATCSLEITINQLHDSIGRFFDFQDQLGQGRWYSCQIEKVDRATNTGRVGP